jgi:NAD(P)H-flavin reductase
MTYIRTSFVGKKELAEKLWLFEFHLEEPQEFSFKAGQYMTLVLGEIRQSYTIVSSESMKDSFLIFVRILRGDLGSSFLTSLDINATAYFLEPDGKFILNEKNKNKSKVFMAENLGVVPIKSQLASFVEKFGRELGTELLLFWGLETNENIYFLEDIKNLARAYPNFNFWLCLERQGSFLGLDPDHCKRGKIESVFTEFAKEKHYGTSQLNSFEYYLCGAKESMITLNDFLLGLGVNKENIVRNDF